VVPQLLTTGSGLWRRVAAGLGALGLLAAMPAAAQAEGAVQRAARTGQLVMGSSAATAPWWPIESLPNSPRLWAGR